MNNINLVGLLFALIAYLELTKTNSIVSSFDTSGNMIVKGGDSKKEEEKSEESDTEEKSEESDTEEEGMSMGYILGVVIMVSVVIGIGGYFIYQMEHTKDISVPLIDDNTLALGAMMAENAQQVDPSGVMNPVADPSAVMGTAADPSAVMGTAADPSAVMGDVADPSTVMEADPSAVMGDIEAPVEDVPVDDAPMGEGMEGGIIGGTIAKLKNQLKSLKRK